jgi:hypothetical protein
MNITLPWLRTRITEGTITLRERLANIADIYFGDRRNREIRHTAVGWRPDESYTEDWSPTASGNREYYKIIRRGG